MSGTFIIVVAAVALVVAWFVWSIRWTAKQTMLGTWVATLRDSSRVTLQFEGVATGGLYKQLTERDGVVLREFGHWTIQFLKLRLIIMASDIKQHPRFGVDTQYWVTFNNNSQMTINGPDRPKWRFQRTAEGVKIDFDAPEVPPASAVDGEIPVLPNPERRCPAATDSHH
jgi:hypothetical protein